jgi:4-hydroxybenzoate polyprenyltransferase
VNAATPRPFVGLLRLLRVGTLFSPAADVAASAAMAGASFDATLARAAAASVCLYAAGMAWNDIADRGVDRATRPERPLVRGDLPLARAVGVGVLLIAVGLALSPCRSHHGLIAALVLAYDFGSKAAPLLGVLTMGTLRALNLATGLWLPNALPDPHRERVLVAATCYGVYIAAVTMLGIFEDAKHVRPRAVAAVQTAPPVAALFALVVVQGGPWPAPCVAAAFALWFLRRNTRAKAWPQAEIRRSMGLLLLGTMIFTASLAWAAGQPVVAAAIAVAIAPARWIARRIALT